MVTKRERERTRKLVTVFDYEHLLQDSVRIKEVEPMLGRIAQIAIPALHRDVAILHRRQALIYEQMADLEEQRANEFEAQRNQGGGGAGGEEQEKG